MQTDSKSEQITAMQTTFVQKYDEPISAEKLAELAAKYGSDVVANVINQMKPDAYEAAEYLVKCLSSGWYQNRAEGERSAHTARGEGSTKESKASATSGISKEAATTLRFTWNYKMEQGWIDKAERDYMLDIFLNGTEPDEEKVQDINFRCLQGMYPNTPAVWFYWLPQHQRRAAANTWIVQSKRENLTPYENA